MSIAEKAYALLGALTPADIQALPPAKRQRFADLCRHLAEVAERPIATPAKVGILADLRRGDRGH